MARAKNDPEVVASSEGTAGAVADLIPLPAETVWTVKDGLMLVGVARTREGAEAIVARHRRRDKGFPVDYRIDEWTVED